MNIDYIISKALKKLLGPPSIRMCTIDNSSRVCSRSELSRVEMRKYSYVGNSCFLVNVSIGSFCSIADYVFIGGAKHPIERVSSSPVFHRGKNIMRTNFQSFPEIPTPRTTIGNDVWIGIGAIIKAGVTIHNGAVIGAGSVVTHDVPAYEIWAGNPARKIRDRFDKETAAKIEKTEWWCKSDEEIRKISKRFNNVEEFIGGVE